jgi:hypothetical protein
MPPVDFDLWLHVVQLTFQILQYGIFFFKVHFISLQECSFAFKPTNQLRHGSHGAVDAPAARFEKNHGDKA